MTTQFKCCKRVFDEKADLVVHLAEAHQIHDEFMVQTRLKTSIVGRGKWKRIFEHMALGKNLKFDQIESGDLLVEE